MHFIYYILNDKIVNEENKTEKIGFYIAHIVGTSCNIRKTNKM